MQCKAFAGWGCYGMSRSEAKPESQADRTVQRLGGIERHQKRFWRLCGLFRVLYKKVRPAMLRHGGGEWVVPTGLGDTS